MRNRKKEENTENLDCWKFLKVSVLNSNIYSSFFFFTSLLIRTVRSAGVDDYSDSLCFFRKIYKNVCSGPFILSFHYDFYSVLTTLFIIDHRLTNNGYF